MVKLLRADLLAAQARLNELLEQKKEPPAE